MSEGKSSFNGEMKVGQVWRDRTGRTFMLEDRRLTDHGPGAEFRLSEVCGDYGRWVSAHKVATQYDLVTG